MAAYRNDERSFWGPTSLAEDFLRGGDPRPSEVTKYNGFMIRTVLLSLGLIASAYADDGTATAPDGWHDAPPGTVASTEEARAQVNANSACRRSDYPNLEMVLYFCTDDTSVWYFTVPSATVPPGYIHRQMFAQDGATFMRTNRHYDGTDAQQADFDAWTRRLVAALPH